MGKTSLAYVSISDSEEIKNDYITFFIDILQTGSLAEFTFLLGKVVFDTLAAKSETRVRGFLAALKSLKGSFGFDAISGTPTFNIQLGDIKHPEYTLDEIFSYIEQCEKPVVIVIDEFQQITKYPEKNVEALLRSHIQRLSNASFVFAGSERTILQEMFASSKRPFYNSAEIMHLGPIDEDIYVNFAQKQFSDYGKSLEDAPVRLAFQLFEGNTFYMQRAMNIAFAETSRDDVCGEETIRRAIKSMVAANDVVFREILSNMSVHQKLTLYSIASERSVVNPLSGKFVKDHSLPSASSVQSALLKLSKSGIVTKAESGYIMTDPLFRIFINGEYSMPEI